MTQRWIRDEHLSIGHVVEYVKTDYDLTVSRQTVYNWVHIGRLDTSGIRVFLKVEYQDTLWWTREEWIDEFLENIET